MFLRDYIEEQYPIKGIIERYTNDPVKRIMDADCFPFDKICMYEGQLQKCVEISADEVISVLDLLSYTKEDAEKVSPEFFEVYNAYMDNIVMESLDIQDIINISRVYKKQQQENKERLA